MDKAAQYVIGIDLGGTNARAVIAGPDGKIVNEVARPSQSEGPAEGTFDVLAACVQEVMHKQGAAKNSVAGIGVGIPGILHNDISPWNPNFPEWKDVPVREMLESRTGLRAAFLNDARCATLGELHLGAGRGVEAMVFVGLGTGIGGGIVVDGKLLLGHNGAIGEIAHHTIDPAGPQCACGNHGCWEAFCGRDHIVSRAMKKLQTGRSSTLLEGLDPTAVLRRSLSPQKITEAAQTGDPLALEVIDEVGYYLGLGIANLVNILNPQRVVIGGGVAQAGDLLLAPARRTARARAIPYLMAECEIVLAELGSNAGVQGAVVLALQRFLPDQAGV